MRCRSSERFTPQWPKRLTKSVVPFNAGSQDVNGPKGPSKTVMAITTCFVRSLKRTTSGDVAKNKTAPSWSLQNLKIPDVRDRVTCKQKDWEGVTWLPHTLRNV